MSGLGLGVLQSLLAGCSSVPSVSVDAGVAGQSESAPLLALSPAALGCAVSVQQRLTVLPPNQAPQELEALLEVDAQVVRLAIFHMGQRMGTLLWNGQKFDQQLSRWWPAQLAPQQVLSDLQLALWPANAVQQAVQSPWRVAVDASSRQLVRGDHVQKLVRYVGPKTLEIVYPQASWSLRIESPEGTALCPVSLERP
nr:DUF3261 domain-containing protein [Acidovorax sp. SRB_14]